MDRLEKVRKDKQKEEKKLEKEKKVTEKEVGKRKASTSGKRKGKALAVGGKKMMHKETVCMVCMKDKGGKWVQCDQCKWWMHQSCVPQNTNILCLMPLMRAHYLDVTFVFISIIVFNVHYSVLIYRLYPFTEDSLLSFSTHF